MPISCHFRNCQSASGHESISCKMRYSNYRSLPLPLPLQPFDACRFQRWLSLVRETLQHQWTHSNRYLTARCLWWRTPGTLATWMTQKSGIAFSTSFSTLLMSLETRLLCVLEGQSDIEWLFVIVNARVNCIPSVWYISQLVGWLVDLLFHY